MKAFRSKLVAGFTLVEIMIVVLIIGILLAIAIPNFVSARETSRAKACVGNLKQLDSASQQYAMDNKMSSATSLTAAQFTGLAPTYLRTFPTCPESGTYAAATSLQSSPTCSLSGNPNSVSTTGAASPVTGTLATSDSADYGYGNHWYHGLP